MSVSEPTGRRAQTKAHNRQAILAAARQVFARMGYGAATVRDIIRATPLASGTFYNYFKSKEEVYQALRDEVALAIRPRLHAERSQAVTAEEFVARSFAAFFEFVAANRENFRSSDSAAEPSRLPMETPEMAASFEDLHADLQLAIGRGLFAGIDAEYLAASMAGVAAEIAGRMMQREACDPAAAAQFATALVLGGIRTLPPSP
jgi:AcrR family transcriptional regulator